MITSNQFYLCSVIQIFRIHMIAQIQQSSFSTVATVTFKSRTHYKFKICLHFWNTLVYHLLFKTVYILQEMVRVRFRDEKDLRHKNIYIIVQKFLILCVFELSFLKSVYVQFWKSKIHVYKYIQIHLYLDFLMFKQKLDVQPTQRI